MVENANRLFAEWSLLNTVQLQAVATWMLKQFVRDLETLETEILGEIVQYDPLAAPSLRERRTRLAGLLAAVQSRIEEAYRAIRERTEEQMQELAEIQQQQERDHYALLFGAKTGTGPLTGLAAVSIVGLTLGQWFDKMAGDLNYRMGATIRMGIDAGEDAGAIVKRVKGRGAGELEKFSPRVIEAAKKSGEVVIRTGVEATAEEVGEQVGAEAAPSIRMGWQSIAVLDNRTTSLCRAYAFKLWDGNLKPIGEHNLPFLPVPRHINCRSRIVPFMLEDDPVNDLTFKGWLATISPADQNKIFGKRTMELYRKGQLTDQDLIRQQEHSFSLDDFRETRDPRLPPEPE